MDRKRWLYGAILFTAFFLIGWAPTWAQPPGLIINGQGTATLTFVPPANYADGTPIGAGELVDYDVYFGDESRFSGPGFRAGCSARPLSRLDATCYPSAATLPAGSGSPVAIQLSLNQDTTIYFTMAAVTANGVWSDFSNEDPVDFTLVITGLQPNPPVVQDVAVTMTCTTSDPAITCTFTVN